MTIPPNWLGAVAKLRRARLEIDLALESIESGPTEWTAAVVTCNAENAYVHLRDSYDLIPKQDRPKTSMPPRNPDGFPFRDLAPVEKPVCRAPGCGNGVIYLDGLCRSCHYHRADGADVGCLITCKGLGVHAENCPNADPLPRMPNVVRDFERASRAMLRPDGSNPNFPACPNCDRRDTIQPGLATKDGVITVGHCRECGWKAQP